MSGLEQIYHETRAAVPGGSLHARAFYMPATPPLGLFRAVGRWFVHWRRRRRYLALADLDDRQLDDIGLTRGEVEWGRDLPLHRNAAVLVAERARVRRHGERPGARRRRTRHGA